MQPQCPQNVGKQITFFDWISTGYFSFPQKEKMTGLLGK